MRGVGAHLRGVCPFKRILKGHAMPIIPGYSKRYKGHLGFLADGGSRGGLEVHGVDRKRSPTRY